MAIDNAWTQADFTFEPEDRTGIGLVGGSYLKFGEVGEDGRAQLMDEGGSVIGYAPIVAMKKVEGHGTVSMVVNDDCRTVSVMIYTAGKVAGGAADSAWGCWKGCFMAVLLSVAIMVLFSLIFL